MMNVCVTSSGLNGADIPGIQPPNLEMVGRVMWAWDSSQIWLLTTICGGGRIQYGLRFYAKQNEIVKQVSKPTSTVPQPDHGGVRL